MADLHVVAVITARAGCEEVVADALRVLVPATREEEGCVSFELYESLATPGAFVTVETWRNQGNLDAHLQSTHVQAAFASTGEHLDGAPGIHPLRPLDV